MSLANGTFIGPYEIVGWLGAGGMGDVYRARDSRLGRDVAIKLIAESLATDAGRVRRFEQEARAAGQLNHPNILAVYDVGVHQGAPYLVSELLEGESLRDRLRSGVPIPAPLVIDYARQTAEGLAAAHAKLIVHRDVKPDNLFITPDGRIKLLDFGIAKLTRPDDEPQGQTVLPTETEAGMVVGTVGYMSPEQVRGEAVDARSDIFSVGAVLHEMLTGRPAFVRHTAADTMVAVLTEEPHDALPSATPLALVRIVARCLEKTRETRFQSARDLAFGLEVLSNSTGTMPATTIVAAPRRSRATTGVTVAGLVLLAAAGWWALTRAPVSRENLLADAKFSRFTDWEGTELGAEISPDGRFVAFVADRDGQFDLFLSQVGTGRSQNLTADLPSLNPPGVVLRSFGFSGDGAEIWFSLNGNPGARKRLMPLSGGPSRPFLGEGDATPAWSPDGSRVAYFNNSDGDPVFVADRTGADAREILPREKGMHNHNMAWSPDGQWIYFVRGPDATTSMDVWRIRPAGGAPERLTETSTAVNFLAPIDSHTLLYVARAEDRSGPWLWSVDVETHATRRVTSGLEQYTSVSTSSDGHRVVATVANPNTKLWRVPLLDRLAEDRDAQPYPTTARALAPRFAGSSLFYLSPTGSGDALWRARDGQSAEVMKGGDSGLAEPPAVSPDGNRVAVVVVKDGKRQLTIMAADGTNAHTLVTSITVQGAAGQSTVDWSSDGRWILSGGSDAQGPGLFKIPADGGDAVRLVTGVASNPVRSPDGGLIVYAGAFVGGSAPLLGVRLDGSAVELPKLGVRQGGYRFQPGGQGLVYLQRIQAPDFWVLDLATKASRQLTRFSNQGQIATFDISPDGKQIVFDRSRENSDIVMIERPR